MVRATADRPAVEEFRPAVLADDVFQEDAAHRGVIRLHDHRGVLRVEEFAPQLLGEGGDAALQDTGVPVAGQRSAVVRRERDVSPAPAVVVTLDHDDAGTGKMPFDGRGECSGSRHHRSFGYRQPRSHGEPAKVGLTVQQDGPVLGGEPVGGGLGKPEPAAECGHAGGEDRGHQLPRPRIGDLRTQPVDELLGRQHLVGENVVRHHGAQLLPAHPEHAADIGAEDLVDGDRTHHDIARLGQPQLSVHRSRGVSADVQYDQFRHVLSSFTA